jgi:ketosteroid isomerase-like protein
MAIWKLLMAAVLLALLVPSVGRSQGALDLTGMATQVVKADADFAKSVADKNRERFLSLIADTAIFSGGTPNELHGRDAIMKEWSAFFAPDGPTLTWAPTKGEVIGAGDLGYTTGRSIFRSKGADGKARGR